MYLVRKTILPLLIILAMLGVWEASVHIFSIDHWLLSPPSVIFRELFKEGVLSLLLSKSLETLQGVMLGLVLAALSSFIAAFAISWSGWIERGVYPILIFVQTVPVIALTPLIIVFFGAGLGGKVVVVMLISFFPLSVATIDGLKSPKSDLVNMFKTLGSSRWQTFFKLRVPYAVPSILTGAKVTIVLAVVGAFVAEYSFGSTGLGNQIKISQANLNTPILYASITTLSLLSVLMFILFEFIERFFLRRYKH